MKNKLSILIAALFISFTFSTAASADVVQLCYTNSLGHTGCCYATGVCANINCPPGWTCANVSSVIGAKITKTSGGGATVTINGVTTPLAGAAFQNAFDQLTKQYLAKGANKAQILKELSDLWNAPSSWKVSDQLLAKYAREFHTTIGSGTTSGGK
jgi:ribose 5-phosphate isomerase RpiB